MSDDRSTLFQSSASAKRAVGEGQVWLSALGLSIGLMMIFGFLGLIFSYGLGVFWPSKLAQITLKPGATTALSDQHTLVGQIVKKQKRLDSGEEEWQLYLGNKDSTGVSFHWIMSREIESVSAPPEWHRAERLENGDLIFRPLGLYRGETMTLAADSPQFEKTLKEKIAAAAVLRDKIKKIEKYEIGSINQKLLRLSQRSRDRNSEAYGAEKEKLEAEFQAAIKRLETLRQEGAQENLSVALPSGTTLSVPLQQILHVYQPNRLGFFEKVGLFLHRLTNFVFDEPREANTEGGIFPAIFGTFIMTILMSLFVTPLGVIAAIYLREYAKQGFWVRLTRISVNNLAGVPSIVFGIFGLGFFVYFCGSRIDQLFFPEALPTPTYGTGGVLWASLTLALLTLPVVIVATEEALSSVPRGLREAALACGASKWQTIQRIVLPSAAPGILTGVILAMARGAGEVAPLMLVGVVKLAPSLVIDGVWPFVHPERKFMHLGFHIYDLGFQSPDAEAAKPMVFATALFLIVLVVIMNLSAILLRNHLRRKYAASTF